MVVCFEDFPRLEISSFKLKNVPGISRMYTNCIKCLHHAESENLNTVVTVPKSRDYVAQSVL